MRSAALLAALTILTTTVFTFGATKPAAAALPTCNNFSWEYIGGSMGAYALIPSAEGGDRRYDCLLAYGNHTWGVWALQRALNKCHNAGLVEDAIYGPKTKAAVTWIQGEARITTDGIYGPQTRTYAMRFPVYNYKNLNWPANYCTGFLP